MILLTLVLIFSILLIIKYKRRADMPPGPMPLPIIGNLHQLSTAPHLALQKLSQIYGGAMTLYMGNIPTVIITDPDYIKEVIIQQSDNTTDRFVSETARIIGNDKDILFSNGAYWKKYRFILASCFTRMKSHLTIMDKIQEETTKLMDAFQVHAESGENVSPRFLFKQYTSNVILGMLFGQRSDYFEKYHDVIKAVDLVEKELAVGNIPDLLPFLSYFYRESRSNLQSALERVWHYSKLSLDEHRRDLQSDPHRVSDMMDLMIHAIHKSDNPSFFDDEGLVRVCSDLLISGTETSSSTLEWLLLFLVNNPNYMEKVRCEINDAMTHAPAGEQSMDLSRRSQTPFLNACIKEALRIRPVGALSLPRRTTSDVKIGPYTIPAATQVITNVYGLAMSPELWSQPEEFNPYRWMDNNNNNNDVEYKFIPFGVGPRSCVGSNLAKDEIYLCISNLILRFNFETIDGVSLDEEGKFGIALTCKQYQLKIKPITQTISINAQGTAMITRG
ncbi:hypothetical protein SAMD00019534_094760 [Acytostelium subglobosum LB1]|uniref:hypothetical protein n=1 Tax=Acytostelium subglobosum LB1 TaxID=1410327 RepID=UPI000644FA63|nr:hypothetical protein SAMD00019534_094760 [Acytostelium subglobosum LB1]GAM26301.1 hypothetical protein SAMD00019534_094760 [Acytostelium subglobosum LB1]|eukprot:XP_012750855.1 hypothetical protein SAMD00019534_094760 [Acytostelium subglobosum LB1]